MSGEDFGGLVISCSALAWPANEVCAVPSLFEMLGSGDSGEEPTCMSPEMGDEATEYP